MLLFFFNQDAEEPIDNDYFIDGGYYPRIYFLGIRDFTQFMYNRVFSIRERSHIQRDYLTLSVIIVVVVGVKR